MAGLPLDLPVRSAKPRQEGITHLMDRGLSVAEVDNLMEVAGASVDIVKLGFGTALATGNLEPKLARYRNHDVPVCLGGTITFDPADKQALIRRLAGEGFTVLSEVGSKDNAKIMAPYRWVELIQGELEAGAWKVICEGRETGTAGIARPDGELREGLIDEIAHGVDPAKVIFEAPQKDQQVLLIKRFGPDVNLGNIPPADVLPLETMRLGLRSDTMDQAP